MHPAVEKKFGEKCFDHALFYQHDESLRFELSQGESFAQQFIQAYSKADRILFELFSNCKNPHACFAFYGEGSFLRNLSVFRALDVCGIKPTTRSTKYWAEEVEEDVTRAFLLFPISTQEISNLLWVAIANDLGVSPSAPGSVYFVNYEGGVIAHPYDDRGMDLIGPNKELLGEFYRKFNDYLLGYDIEAMRGWFGDV